MTSDSNAGSTFYPESSSNTIPGYLILNMAVRGDVSTGKKWN